MDSFSPSRRSVVAALLYFGGDGGGDGHDDEELLRIKRMRKTTMKMILVVVVVVLVLLMMTIFYIYIKSIFENLSIVAMKLYIYAVIIPRGRSWCSYNAHILTASFSLSFFRFFKQFSKHYTRSFAA